MNSIDIVFPASPKSKSITNHLFIKRKMKRPQKIIKHAEKKQQSKDFQNQMNYFSQFIHKTKIHSNHDKQIRYSNTPTQVLSQRLKIKLSPEKIMQRTNFPKVYKQLSQQNYDLSFLNQRNSHQIKIKRYKQDDNINNFYYSTNLNEESLEKKQKNNQFNNSKTLKNNYVNLLNMTSYKNSESQQFRILLSRSAKKYQNYNGLQGLRILPSLSKKNWKISKKQ